LPPRSPQLLTPHARQTQLHAGYLRPGETEAEVLAVPAIPCEAINDSRELVLAFRDQDTAVALPQLGGALRRAVVALGVYA
jgi:hypothetical protein